jgi:ferredoxin
MATVWIDAEECMGAGCCSQVAPSVFHQRSDGTWAVKEDRPHFDQVVVFDGGVGEGHGPEGPEGKARIPESVVDLVIEAADECPAGCIYVEA